MNSWQGDVGESHRMLLVADSYSSLVLVLISILIKIVLTLVLIMMCFFTHQGWGTNEKWKCRHNFTSQSLLKYFFWSAFTRYELHVRFLPKDLRDLFSKDPVTFYYLFDQVQSVTFLAFFNTSLFSSHLSREGYVFHLVHLSAGLLVLGELWVNFHA